MKHLPLTGMLLIIFGAIVPIAFAQDTGRINPEPDEYYALYCLNDTLEIYRTVPQRELLTQAPFSTVVQQQRETTLSIGNGITLTRHDDDSFTVSGSNGNRAPEPGDKDFSMSACYLTNIGMPTPPPTVARTPQVRPTPLFQEGEDRGIDYCIYTFMYFNTGADGLFNCVATVTSADVITYSTFRLPGAPNAGISVPTIFYYICPNGGPVVIGLVAVPFVLRRRRR